MKLCAAVSFVAIVLAPAVHGQAIPAAPSSDATLVAVARMERSLTRLAEAMEKTVAQQEVSLQMRRVELSSILLVNADRRVLELTQERDSIGEMIRDSAQGLEDMQARLAKQPSSEASESAQATTRMYEREAEKAGDRLKAVESALVEAQQAVDTLRQDAQDWQTLIDRYFQRPNG